MYFRKQIKKNSKNISIYDGISYDKEGNEVTILDVLKKLKILILMKKYLKMIILNY